MRVATKTYSTHRTSAALLWSILFLGVAILATNAAAHESKGSNAPQTKRINDALRRGWTDHGFTPSKPATDGEWCRRVYLDVLGRIPTVTELQSFQMDRSRNRQRRLVDRLLGAEYADEYARYWTTVWTNILIGRTGGVDRMSIASREGMETYLTDAIRNNKPYDQLARELITAKGSCRPGDADFNGAANFLADKLAEDGVQATAKTSQVFLGMAVQCTQCHNHPFNDVGQNQFWELNAFFRQAGVERLPDDQRRRGVARVVERAFPGEGGDPTKAELYYELRNGKLKVAYPVFIDGTSLAALYADRGEDFGDSGLLENVNRREELVKLILASTEFEQAIVNRIWAHFLGYGFTKPIDDIGPHNPPSHPELLAELGREFRAASFDLKELMRWIVLSEAYALSSRVGRSNEKDDPTLGARPMFSRFYLRQMQAEQLYDSLLVATAADATVADENQRRQLKQRWLDQLATAFGTDENDEATTFNGSIPQALLLMNGNLVRQATSDRPGSFLYRVATNQKLSSAEKIKYLYLAAFSRRPTRGEIALSNQLLDARNGNVAAALQDIWWALLNSNEFILNH